jgi:hypothetical protein
MLTCYYVVVHPEFKNMIGEEGYPPKQVFHVEFLRVASCCVIQNSIFVSVNTTVQIFMLIMTCFDPCWVIIRCISVYLEAEFLFNMDPYFLHI